MVLNLVSCPRNLSTALMYSFAQNPGMTVVDEPFYGMYLEKTGIEHPGRDEIMNSMVCNEEKIYQSIQELHSSGNDVFLKNMSQHMAQIENLEPMKSWKHIFYIRDPRSVIASFAKVIPNLTLQDIGFGYMKDWFEFFSDSQPVVLDAEDLLLDPQSTLQSLYHSLDIPFSQNVLVWEKGPKEYDGIWSKYWYDRVQGSEGFEMKEQIEYPVLTDYQLELYEQAVENYLYLKQKKK